MQQNNLSSIYSTGAQLISQTVPETFLEGNWGHRGGLEAVSPVGSRGQAPDQQVRGQSPTEADDRYKSKIFVLIAMFMQKSSCN